MKVKEVMKILEKETTQEIADQLGINKSTVQRKLRKHGFNFDNAKKEWFFDKEGDPPYEADFLHVNKSAAAATKPTAATEKNSKKDIEKDEIIHSTDINFQEKEKILSKCFQPDQVDSLMKLVKIHSERHEKLMKDKFSELSGLIKEKKQEKEEVNNSFTLYEKVKALPNDEKIRKTIVISEQIAIDLDKFAYNERLNKSDIIHIALYELFKKQNFYNS